MPLDREDDGAKLPREGVDSVAAFVPLVLAKGGSDVLAEAARRLKTFHPHCFAAAVAVEMDWLIARRRSSDSPADPPRL